MISILEILLCAFIFPTTILHAFPDGAPSDVCENFSPIRGHKTMPRPSMTSPFQIIQSSQFWRPGQSIEVEVIPYDASTNQGFKGFIIQALDANTLEFIGEFSAGSGIRLLSECSAATHSDSRVKNSAFFVWNPPHDRSGGEIIFRATIVAERDIYWQNLLSELLMR